MKTSRKEKLCQAITSGNARTKTIQDCAKANATYPPNRHRIEGDQGVTMADSLRKYTTWKLIKRVEKILKCAVGAYYSDGGAKVAQVFGDKPPR